LTLARPRQAVCAFENVNTEASGRSEIPSEQGIRETLPLVDYRRLTLKAGTAYLPVKGMAADLGGIPPAKRAVAGTLRALIRHSGMTVEEFLDKL
jgi:thiamine biosynthesis lipoprotein ApbE